MLAHGLVPRHRRRHRRRLGRRPARPQGPVTLIEAEPHLAHHSSGRSAALFEETYGRPTTVALNRASRAELEARGVLTPRGLLLVATPEEEGPSRPTSPRLGWPRSGSTRPGRSGRCWGRA